MTTNTLALQSRPKFWHDVIDQDLACQVLTTSVRTGALNPGYLFTGPTGTGKTTLALLFVRSLFCVARDPATSNPCGLCDHCVLLDSDSHPDLKYVDSSSERSVEFIRSELKPFLAVSPFSAPFKVAIIDEAHLYLNDGISAFLTLLESMPVNSSRSILIFCTSEGDRMNKAVRNRCLTLPLGRITNEGLVRAVRRQHPSLSENVVRLLAEELEGSFRSVWTTVETLLKTGKPADESVAMQLVGGVAQQDREKLMSHIAEGNAPAVIKLWDGWMNRGASPAVVSRQFIRDVIRTIADHQPAWAFRALTFLSRAEVLGTAHASLGALLQLIEVRAQTPSGPPRQPAPTPASLPMPTVAPEAAPVVAAPQELAPAPVPVQTKPEPVAAPTKLAPGWGWLERAVEAHSPVTSEPEPVTMPKQDPEPAAQPTTDLSSWSWN